MINVRFYSYKGALCLKVDGHSNAAPKGEDVICAGASSLAVALADFVSIMAANGELEKEPTIQMQNGLAKIKATPKAESRAKMLLLFSVITVGMKALARNYPDYIRLKLFEQSDIEGFSK